jgi:hypothetical protein
MAAGFPVKTSWAAGDVYTAAGVDDMAGTINIFSPVGVTSGYVPSANGSATSVTWVPQSSAPTSLNYAAGKNAIINGDFGIWQRGTSFSPANTAYTADRWYVDATTAYPTSQTISQQTFTPGTAPVSGYEGTYYLRYAYTYAPGNPGSYIGQKIEDVRTYAGQTVTISFWAKVASAAALSVNLVQNFGSGGSTSATTSVGTPSATTSWQRFTYSVSVPSISGKTIGTSSFLDLRIFAPNASSTTDIWGVQLEAGSTATNFQTATGTKQGELAACQRYYWRSNTAGNNYTRVATGMAYSSTIAGLTIPLPVSMRVIPTAVEYSGLQVTDTVNFYAVTATTLNAANSSPNFVAVDFTVASGLTQFRAYYTGQTSSSGYLGLTAEL